MLFRSAIRRALAKKFGDLPETLVAQIEAVTELQECDALLDRALEAQGLADFAAN